MYLGHPSVDAALLRSIVPLCVLHTQVELVAGHLTPVGIAEAKCSSEDRHSTTRRRTHLVMLGVLPRDRVHKINEIKVNYTSALPANSSYSM